jgi:hypothetical protein
MKHLKWTLAAALACAALSTGAFAQAKPTTSPDAPNAGKTHTTPTKSNSQRQLHAQAGGVRDWNAIDKNHDHLISPEEMEAALKQKPQQGNKGATTK